MAPTAATTPNYWQPPVEFYGNPVYGGELRINYEDPLDHANIWGAQSGVTVRYRQPTMSSIVAEDPYQAGRIIPDLANNWQSASDLTSITINFENAADATRCAVIEIIKRPHREYQRAALKSAFEPYDADTGARLARRMIDRFDLFFQGFQRLPDIILNFQIGRLLQTILLLIDQAQ